MKLSEIEIVDALGNPSKEHLKTFGDLGEVIGNNGKFEIYEAIFGNQEVFYIKLDDLPICYLIIQNQNNHHWLMELWTDPNHRQQSLARQLVIFVVETIKKAVFIDLQITQSSASLWEEMIKSGDLRPSVIDLENGKMTSYNKDNPEDQNRPMYNKTVPGITRPLLAPGKEKSVTWLFETGIPRFGILKETIKFSKLNHPRKFS